MNDSKTLLARRAVKLGELSRFTFPPLPALPESFLNRFPELRVYENEKKIWLDQFTHALSQLLSAPQQ